MRSWSHERRAAASGVKRPVNPPISTLNAGARVPAHRIRENKPHGRPASIRGMRSSFASVEEVVMFTSNPFAAVADSLPESALQLYLVVMAVAVIAGTLFDIVHKGSAKYFFENMRRS